MRTFALITGLVMAAAPSFADTIHTAGGKSITDVTVLSEGLDKVLYKDGRTERSIDAQNVISVVFTDKPRAMMEADGFLLDGDLGSAVIVLDDYVGAILAGAEKERKKWAPANAAWRVVELRQALGDLPGVVSAATRVIDNYGDTRYLPAAYLAKADAFYWNEEGPKAQSTLKNFETAITAKGMSERWRMECDLALILTNDGLSATARRTALSGVSDRAGSAFATVKNRALVAQGESFLSEVVVSAAKAAQNVPAALKVFETVLKDPKADDATLSGAYVGMGDCLFHSAAKSLDKDELKKAALAYLRVAAVYPEQSRYVAKALFYGGRSLDLMGDDENQDRAQKLYAEVYFTFPESNWAREAKNFSRR